MDKLSNPHDSITNLESFVKALFECGTQKSVEICRKNFELARPFSFPSPITYQGYSDWKNVRGKIIEKICQARILLAFDMSQSIRDKIDFYDLICCAVFPYSQDDEINKFIYSEIIKYTNSEAVRDHYIEKLYKLNKKREALLSDNIDRKIYPFIVDVDKMLKAMEYLNSCNFSVNNFVVEDANIDNEKKEILFTIGALRGPVECGDYYYFRFRMIGVENFNIKNSYNEESPHIIDSQIIGESGNITFTCGASLKVSAKKIEMVSVKMQHSELNYDTWTFKKFDIVNLL